MHWLDGMDWLSLTFAMALWVVVLGVVVYAAFWEATRPPRRRRGS